MKTYFCLLLLIGSSAAAPKRHKSSKKYSCLSSSIESTENIQNSFVDTLPPHIQSSIDDIENQRGIERIPGLTVTERDLQFYLYTQNDNRKTQISESNYYLINDRKPTKILIHGWIQSSESHWITLMKDAYLRSHDYNIIVVDWESTAYRAYAKSAFATKEAGHLVADFILQAVLPLDSIHIIGHSLGALVAGYAAKEIIRKTTIKKIARISALDPSGPAFQEVSYPPSEKLSKNDAEMVDVTHTDSEYYGTFQKPGTVEFYPNGGERQQPGCASLKLDTDGVSCSHTRAVYLFIESISSQNFVATECASWSKYKEGECTANKLAIYGDNLKTGTTGIYFFKTKNKEPYALGAYNNLTQS